MTTITRQISTLLFLAVISTACSTAASEETASVVTTTVSPTSVRPTLDIPTTQPTNPPGTTSLPSPSTAASSGAAGGISVDIARAVPFTDQLTFDIFSPEQNQDAPVVVLFHGGSWYGGAKENVEPFALELATAGYVVFNATYRTGFAGGGYPQSYEDIGCAIGVANSMASTYGGDPDRVFVAGHSAGAQLAATVLFAGDAFAGGNCASDGAIDAAGFIGISGPYDVSGFAGLLSTWFGGDIADIPDVFAAGGPFAYLDRPPVPVLLIHGTADELVPTTLTTGLADALEQTGWTVQLTILDGASHGGVIDPLISASETIAAIDSFIDP